MPGEVTETMGDEDGVRAQLNALIERIRDAVEDAWDGYIVGPINLISVELNNPSWIRIFTPDHSEERVGKLPGVARQIADWVQEFIAKFQCQFNCMTCIEIDPQFGMMTVRGGHRVTGF